jgi:long-chain fatty acid transport protein
MKKGKQLISIVVFLVFLSSLALANGLNLNGLGSKAIAMGGAFVGLADDYSAIFWNPAGIAQFNMKTFGLTVDDVIPSGTYELQGIVDAKTVSKHFLTGLVGYYHPVSDDLVVGIGAYTPSGLGAEWDGADFAPVAAGGVYDWMSKIGVVTISPVLAYKISDQFSFGATFNFNYGMFDIKTHAGIVRDPLGNPVINPYTGGVFDLGQQIMEMSGWGYGATFGVLYTSDYFNIGATLRTPSKITFKGDATISDFDIIGMINPALAGVSIPTTSEVEGEVTYPMWLCGGVAFMPADGLTLTADLQHTNWEKVDVVEFMFSDPVWQLITGGSDEFVLHFRNATQIRFGIEYEMNGLALRGGYYWDPSPIPDETMNVLVPNYDFNNFSFGIGYRSNGMSIDFVVEYLIGKERVVPLTYTEAMPGTYNMKIWAPGVSLSYSF